MDYWQEEAGKVKYILKFKVGVSRIPKILDTPGGIRGASSRAPLSVLKFLTGPFKVGVILWLVLAGPVLAQEIGPETAPVDFARLLFPALTLFLPLGLVLLISSAMPEEQAPATAINLVVVWAVAALAYFAVGFAFQFGGIAQVSPRPDLSGLYWEWYPLDRSVATEAARQWGVIALQGWFLAGEAVTPGALGLFLSHLSLVGAAALIPVGGLAERVRGTTSVLIGLVMGGLIYPVAGNWLWGGGWLAHLGSSLGLGHGLVDFGGASLIFWSGSLVALAALLLLRATADDQPDRGEEVVVSPGPDSPLTVYEPEPSGPAEEELLPTVPMPPAYLPILSLLGAGLVLVGWLGLAGGTHIPTALDFSPLRAGLNGLLAGLSAALAAAGYSWFTTHRLDPLMTGRGLVAGVVVMAAGAPFVPPWAAVGAGLVMGLLLPPLVYLFDRGLRLADEQGVLATYGLAGLFGLLLVALLADGRAGQGWNGVSGPGVSGAVAGDWSGQLQAQLVGLGAVGVMALLLGLALFRAVIAAANAWSRSGLELARSEPEAAPAEEEEEEAEEAP